MKYSRRCLPHVEVEGGSYFITFSTYHVVLDDACKKIVFDTVLYWDKKKYDLIACVVMEDHVHLALKTALELEKVMHSIKSFSAHAINNTMKRNGKVWVSERYDRVIKDQTALLDIVQYIIENPVKMGIVDCWSEYPYVYLKEDCLEDFF